MTKSIYADFQIGVRLSPRDADLWRLRSMAYSRLAAEGLRSREGKASGHGFRTNQKLKAQNGFAPFAPLPLCGKRASRWQEEDVGTTVVDFVRYFYAGRSMHSAGGVEGLLMVLDRVSTSEYNQSSGDPTDDDYFPLMDRIGNVSGCKKASTATPATQLDAIYDYDALGQEVRSSGPAAEAISNNNNLPFYGTEPSGDTWRLAPVQRGSTNPQPTPIR